LAVAACGDSTDAPSEWRLLFPSGEPGQRFQDEINGFSITYPESWRFDPVELEALSEAFAATGQELVFAGGLPRKPSGVLPNDPALTITKSAVAGGLDSAQLATSRIGGLSGSLEDAGFTLESQDAIRLGGLAGRVVEYRVVDATAVRADAPEGPLAAVAAFLAHEGIGWAVTCSMLAATAENLTECTAVLESLEVGE
jgi:hypothetical protein